MSKILAKRKLAPAVYEMQVVHPRLASKAMAGQFVIIRIGDIGERIPLTIADFNREEGTVTLIFQEIGKSTLELGHLNTGDDLHDLVGSIALNVHRPATRTRNFGRPLTHQFLYLSLVVHGRLQIRGNRRLRVEPMHGGILFRPDARFAFHLVSSFH